MRHPIRVAPLFAPLVVALTLLATPNAHAESDELAAVNLELIRAERASRQTLALLDEARLSGQVQPLRCVDVALSRLHSATRLIEDRRDHIVRAEARGDREEVERHARIVTYLARNIRARARDAMACLHPQAPVGHTIVEVTVEPGTPRIEDIGPPPPERRFRRY